MVVCLILCRFCPNQLICCAWLLVFLIDLGLMWFNCLKVFISMKSYMSLLLSNFKLDKQVNAVNFRIIWILYVAFMSLIFSSFPSLLKLLLIAIVVKLSSWSVQYWQWLRLWTALNLLYVFILYYSKLLKCTFVLKSFNFTQHVAVLSIIMWNRWCKYYMITSFDFIKKHILINVCFIWTV